MKALVNFIDDVLDYMSSALKSNIVDYCDLETPNDKWTFTAKNGSVGTILEIKGVPKDLHSSYFYIDIVDRLGSSFSQFFDKEGYAMQFYFASDVSNTEELLRKTYEKSREATKNLQLDLDDIFESRIRTLKHVITDEKCFVVLWSKPSLLTKEEAKKNAVTVFDYVSKDGINPFIGYEKLIQKHINFVTYVEREFIDTGVLVKRLNVYQAFREVRASMNPNVDQNWQIILPGQKILPSVRRKMPEKEEYDIMYPKLSWQLLTEDAEEITDKIVKVGDYLYSSCYIDMLPDMSLNRLVSFNDLASRMSAIGGSWRYSMLLEGNGMSLINFKKVMTRILLIFNKANNGLLRDATEYLDAINVNRLDTIAKIKINFATWCKTEYVALKGKEPFLDLKKIINQHELMIRTLEGWEDAKVIQAVGDPVESVVCSSLSMKTDSIAPASAIPLSEAMKLIPVARPTSPWESGGTTFRSISGKLIPFRPFSSYQDTFNTLIWSPPGSGKSVLMNYLNTGLCLEEANRNLPYIRTIDSGESSFGMALLIKSALPPKLAHQSITAYMYNTPQYAINILDTLPGCRTPLKQDSSFAANFLMQLINPPPETASAMEGLIDVTLREAYKYYSDLQNPKKFPIGREIEIEEKLRKAGFVLKPNTSCFEVIDFLMLKGFHVEAGVIQTYAVPLIEDLSLIVTQSETIKNMYDIRKDAGNELLIDQFTRAIGEAITKYPILKNRTMVNISNSNIVSYELGNVVMGASSEMRAIFFMLAIYLLGKDYFVHPDEINQIPYNETFKISQSAPIDFYKKFYKDRFTKLKETKKLLNIDEFHLTAGATYLIRQIEEYMKTGRKYNVGITLASQQHNHFTQNILDNTSAFYVMSTMTEKQVEEIKGQFDLSDGEAKIIKESLGSRQGRRYFLARYRMGGDANPIKKDRWTSLVCSAVLSPEELWAYNSTAIVAMVRNKLYERIGIAKTRRNLAKLYPDPNRIKEMSERLDINKNIPEQERNKSLTDSIVSKIYREMDEAGLLSG